MKTRNVTNTVILGDNLDIMRDMEDGCIDLIYADPWRLTRVRIGVHSMTYGRWVKRLSKVYGDTLDSDAQAVEGYSIYLHCDTHSLPESHMHLWHERLSE